MPDEEPSADPPPEDPWSSPPAGWGPATPPAALPPWAPTPNEDQTVDPSEQPRFEDPAAPSDPWRIPPQPRWDPAAEPPPAEPTVTDAPAMPPTYYLPLPQTEPNPAFPPRGADPNATAFDLPPSATSPRSTPRPPESRPPMPPARPPGPPPAVYDEPWRRETAQRQRTGRRGLPLRPILIGVAGLAVVALIAAGAVVLTRHGAHDAPAGPAAKLAATTFAPDPAAKSDGRDQELVGVASAGSIVVAIGGEADTADYRGEFLVSSDGGRSFRLADVRTPDGAEPGYGDTPRVVAGSEGAWVALGGSRTGTAVWTSRDARTWTRQPDSTGAVFGHDKITRVARTSSGFVAVGDTSQKGDYSDAVPVVWLSSDGRQWERLGNDQLKMSLSGGPLSLIDVAAHDNAVIVYGWTTDAKGLVTQDGVWRSADGGRSWAAADVPHPKGTAGPGIAIGATSDGFVAGRNASSKSERYGVIMTSADGDRWQPAGEIHLPGYGGLQRLSGSDRGLAAVIGADKKVLLARSEDGRTWQNGGEVPTSSGRTVEGVAVTAGATIVAGREDDGQDTDGVLAVRDTLGQEVPVDVSAIAGADQPDQTVTSVAAGPDLQVAVGGTNGDGAVWTSPDGTRWTRAGDSGQALARPGKQRLINVTPGGAGWVAVGYDAGRPLVVTSADGTSWRAAEGFDPGSGHVATYAAAAGKAGYVVVGESGFSAGAWFSPDLKSWKAGSGGDLGGKATANRWMRGVVATPSGFVAVGGLSDPAVKDAPQGRPAVWTSADGRKWTLKELPQPAGSLEGWFDRVAVRGGTLVATGTATTSSGRTAFAFVSSDGGVSWQEVRLPRAGQDGADSSDHSSLSTAVTATPRGFVLAGTAGRPGREDVVLWTSADGRSWSAQAPEGTGLSGRGDQWLTGLTTLGSDLLAVGISADHTGERPTLWRRPLP
ncbi:hypothetical protein [Actinomadura sp. DC4]|uniref:hypothetical protein n=1 Tax=Actinomadura sp. DC4 TaxID=3055069 RepID=UPI0025B00FB7|nr:hypothetical protein [Actinomadura sp. DC4]MDN3357994.1 hypothetical protein [Actinomadura sp. DC4]